MLSCRKALRSVQSTKVFPVPLVAQTITEGMKGRQQVTAPRGSDNTETPGQGSTLHGVHRNLSTAPSKNRFSSRNSQKDGKFLEFVAKKHLKGPLYCKGTRYPVFPRKAERVPISYLARAQPNGKRQENPKQRMEGKRRLPGAAALTASR